jgi:hypothetical protein
MYRQQQHCWHHQQHTHRVAMPCRTESPLGGGSCCRYGCRFYLSHHHAALVDGDELRALTAAQQQLHPAAAAAAEGYRCASPCLLAVSSLALPTICHCLLVASLLSSSSPTRGNEHSVPYQAEFHHRRRLHGRRRRRPVHFVVLPAGACSGLPRTAGGDHCTR